MKNLFVLIVSLLFFCCSSESAGTSSNTTNSVAFYVQDTLSQARVFTVKVFDAKHTILNPKIVDSIQSDSLGLVILEKPLPKAYRIEVSSNSSDSTSLGLNFTNLNAIPDTLHLQKSIEFQGEVSFDALMDSAWVLVVGSDKYQKVNADGSYLFKGVSQGAVNLKIVYWNKGVLIEGDDYSITLSSDKSQTINLSQECSDSNEMTEVEGTKVIGTQWYYSGDKIYNWDDCSLQMNEGVLFSHENVEGFFVMKDELIFWNNIGSTWVRKDLKTLKKTEEKVLDDFLLVKTALFNKGQILLVLGLEPDTFNVVQFESWSNFLLYKIEKESKIEIKNCEYEVCKPKLVWGTEFLFLLNQNVLEVRSITDMNLIIRKITLNKTYKNVLIGSQNNLILISESNSLDFYETEDYSLVRSVALPPKIEKESGIFGVP